MFSSQMLSSGNLPIINFGFISTYNFHLLHFITSILNQHLIFHKHLDSFKLDFKTVQNFITNALVALPIFILAYPN